MTFTQTFVLVAWLLMPLHAVVFLVMFGWPARARDRTMAWHLWITTAIAGLEPVGFLLSGISLWPAVAIYAASFVVIWWRIILLWQTRHVRQANGFTDQQSR